MNHLKPTEILKALVTSGVGKTEAAFKKLLVLGIMAGAYIAFAGAASTMGAFNLLLVPETYGLGRALSGSLFAGGLAMVVLAGAELFTGNSLITLTVLERRTSLTKMLRNWVIVYIANFIGSVLVAFLVYKTGIFASGAQMMGAMTVKMAVGKVNLSFGQALASGILCNWLVCLAVWMATGASSTAGKVSAIFFPIWIFVTCGFEHCVANMYFIPAGIFAALDPEFAALSGVSGEALANLNWGGMFINNLLPVTIGNIIGGAVFVATAYWLAFKGSKTKSAIEEVKRDA